MTIKEKIIATELRYERHRYQRLSEIGVGATMLGLQERIVSDLEHGLIDISGDVGLLDAEFETAEDLKGRGGKQYVRFNGEVLYFPNAKYGKYVCKAKEAVV